MGLSYVMNLNPPWSAVVNVRIPTLQPHVYLVLMFTSVYIVFLLCTTIHMNVPNYLTVERGLVHFGSDVRRIS